MAREKDSKIDGLHVFEPPEMFSFLHLVTHSVQVSVQIVSNCEVKKKNKHLKKTYLNKGTEFARRNPAPVDMVNIM